MNDILSKLKDKFGKRYGQDLANMNKNVYISAKNDKGSFEVPVVTLSELGGTVTVGTGAANLNPPARVSLIFKNMKATTFIYRIAVPFSECEIAADKPEYFNYLFDSIMNKATGNYLVTVGQPDKVRFGSKFIDATLRQDNDDFIEIRFTGEWASEEEDLT